MLRNRNKEVLQQIDMMLMPGTGCRTELRMCLFGEDVTVSVPDETMKKIVELVKETGV